MDDLSIQEYTFIYLYLIGIPEIATNFSTNVDDV